MSPWQETALQWMSSVLDPRVSGSLSTRSFRVGLIAILISLSLSLLYFRSEARYFYDRIRPYPSVSIMDNAHELEYADDFWPHFANVTSLPPVSMREAKSGCTWTKDDDVDFNFGEGSGLFLDLSWVKKDMKDRELSVFRRMWQDVVMNKLVPYAEVSHRFHGRGIVIVGGDGASLKRMGVIFRQLERLGCTLPIEVHYYGDEMSPETKAEIEELWKAGPLYFNDLSLKDNIKASTYNEQYGNHYQLKTAAIVNSRFEEPFLLDSDNVPMVDIEILYDSDVYKKYGTVFWPDVSRTRVNNPIWPITNTRCRMDEYEQESGQLLVNKRKFWYHLQLAAWLIDSPENEGRFQSWILGDKDCFRFAWHALKTKYGRPSRWITSVGTLNNGFYCGHTFAQHHPDPDGQIAFLHGGLLKTIPHGVLQHQLDNKGGVFQAYKQSTHDQDPSYNTHVEMGFDNFEYMTRPEGVTPASCMHFSKIKPRPLEEILPGFQDVFREIGGYWMLQDQEDCEHQWGGCKDKG